MKIKSMWLVMLAWICVSASAIEIQITQGYASQTQVAVVPFFWKANGAMPEQPANFINANLSRTGQFTTLDESNMLSFPTNIESVFYNDWRLLNQEYLVLGRIEQVGEQDLYNVHFSLHNVNAENIVYQGNLSVKKQFLRDAAHKISDVVYEKLTGVRGVFSTKIAYVTRKQEGSKIRHELKIADADGGRVQTILSKFEPVISLSWSSDKRQIAYATFDRGVWKVIAQNIASGETTVIADYPNATNSAPAFSPDGTKIAFQSSKSGNFEIYVKDLTTGVVSQITQHRAIDTEPNWSSDGKYLAFTSNRGGKPQVYRAQVSNGRVERLTFEGKYNARPRFTEDGNYLIVVNQMESQYNIAALELATNDFNVITKTPSDESPSISPNGTMLIYTTKSGNKSVLAWVSIDGKVTSSMPPEVGDVREPAWSPY